MCNDCLHVCLCRCACDVSQPTGNKHNAELRRTAPGAKATRRKFSCVSPPPKHGQISKCHKIFLDTVLKIIFSKTNIPGSKCVTCSSFMDIQYLKYLKISHKMVKNHFKKIKNYWKCVLIQTKHHNFKTFCSYSRNYVQ